MYAYYNLAPTSSIINVYPTEHSKNDDLTIWLPNKDLSIISINAVFIISFSLNLNFFAAFTKHSRSKSLLFIFPFICGDNDSFTLDNNIK